MLVARSLVSFHGLGICELYSRLYRVLKSEFHDETECKISEDINGENFFPPEKDKTLP